MPNPPQASPRQPGLDLLRAIAIVLVFAYHWQVVVSGDDTFGLTTRIGWVGVDLFFALSGYLIGRQVFAGLARGGRLSVAAFISRRALRTWPAFWVVLAAYFLWPAALGGREPPPLWRFLTFTQNWGLQPGTAFSHAWSLCIEEQFYLLLPLLVLAAQRLRWSARAWWALGVAAVLAACAWRGLLWARFGEDGNPITGYYPHIYYATLARMDEFLPGLALAAIECFYPALWLRAQAHGRVIGLAALAFAAAMVWATDRFFFIEGQGYGAFMTTFGYSLIALACAGLVFAVQLPGTWLAQHAVPGAGWLARWSYSLYLTHKAVMFAGKEMAAAQGWGDGVRMAVIVLASLAVGGALYIAVERPFMRWRGRHALPLFAFNRQSAATRA